MKILLAPNSLKGSLDAWEVASALARGFAAGCPGAEIVELPVADGGDATAAVLVRALGGRLESAQVTDALGRECTASWGLLPDGTAVVDVASASGIARLGSEERDPWTATSFGTGQLLVAAVEHGCRNVTVGVGGSATVDGGAGLLEAVGVRLLDGEGRPIPRGARGLGSLARIDRSSLHSGVHDASITVACDVKSPLLGPAGAARQFGPQKGATPEMVERLEAGLERVAAVIDAEFGIDVRSAARGGAAGGIAAALHGVLGAELVDGIDLVLRRVDFDAKVEGADVVVTAEGRLDTQTLSNKGPYGVAVAARRHAVPVVIIAGSVVDAPGFDMFDAVFSLCRGPMTLEDAMRDASPLLEATAREIGRLMSATARHNV
jgi:glycerate kinase